LQPQLDGLLLLVTLQMNSIAKSRAKFMFCEPENELGLL